MKSLLFGLFGLVSVTLAPGGEAGAYTFTLNNATGGSICAAMRHYAPSGTGHTQNTEGWYCTATASLPLNFDHEACIAVLVNGEDWVDRHSDQIPLPVHTMPVSPRTTFSVHLAAFSSAGGVWRYVSTKLVSSGLDLFSDNVARTLPEWEQRMTTQYSGFKRFYCMNAANFGSIDVR
jgi:hypothetical protein